MPLSTDNLIDFKCLKCGKCCSNLIVTISDCKFGIYLEPDEIEMFPPELVIPLYGKYINTDEEEVIAYQLNARICPLLVNNLCIKYSQRPLICRTYPLMQYSLTRIEFHSACSAIRQAVEQQKCINPNSLQEELEVIRKRMQQTFEDCYIFPLNRREWIKW